MSPFPFFVRIVRSCAFAVVFAAGALAVRAADEIVSNETGVARTTAYSLHEWHEADGLPHDEIARVLQDAHGFLWVATAEGLARFDSVHFDNFADSLRAAGASPSIRTLAEPAGLGLVCAPVEGGLYGLHGETWQPLPVPRNVPVNALFTGPDDTLWASCDDRTLRRVRAGGVESFPVVELGSTRQDAYFATDEHQRLWIATGAFLGRFEHGRFVRDTAGLSGPEYRIASSHHGGPWIAVRERLHKLTDGRPDAGVPLPPLVGAHYIRTLFEDHTGTLWIGTRSQGLFIFAHGRIAAVPISSEDVRSICEDSEGNIWIGTNGGGLDRLRLRDFRLFDQASGLRDNFSYTVCEDAEGTIWFGNRDGSVARLKDGRIDTIAARLGWRQLNARSVVPDGHGRLWVTSGIGIYQVDPAREQLLRMTSLSDQKLVRASFVARNGDYWISVDPNRVGRVRGGNFESFGPEAGLVGQEFRCLTEDPAGNIWVGSADGRVFRFDGKRFQPIPLGPAPLGAVQAICFESPDVIWFGLNRTGLGVLDHGVFRTFDTRHGLPDNRITDIIRDNTGRFWFGSTSGIFSVRDESLTQLREGRIDRVQALMMGRDDSTTGLSCLGMFKPSTWKDHAGRLWFTTRKGVLMFDPATVNTDVMSPPVFLSEVKFDGRRQPDTTDPLRISTRVRKTELRLSVLRFSAPDRVQIRYRLAGFDSEWVNAGSERVATYPSLPPGDYRFEAISSLSNGVWNKDGVSFAIVVVPVWWQSWWFFTLAVVAATSLVVIVVRAWSHRRLHQRVQRLERESAIERERTRIARDIHDDLGANLARISLLTQSARQDDARESDAHLRQIYQSVSEITRSMDEIVWAVNPRHDQLDSLADYLVSFSQSFLSAAGIRCRLDLPRELPPLPVSSHVRHTLYLGLKETLHNIVKHSGATEVHLAMKVADGELSLVVQDDGRGFDPSGPPSADPDRSAGGNGLENMRRRLEEISGTCRIVSRPGQGTVVRFTLPFDLPPVTPVEHA